MFYLHLSNKTENLIRQLTEVLSLDEDRDPFDPEYFLIQSQGMERMLSQRLSERFTSWCNYEYMLPTRFFALMADRLGVEPGPEDYAREKLCWHLENILRTVGGEQFAVLKAYVAADSNGMKRYQLSQQLAYVFDQYQIMRLAMIDGWEQGKLFTANKNGAERYQMELWNLLRDTIGHSRHRGVFLRDLINILSGDADFSPVLPKRLSVFGLHSLPPILLNCLQALARHCDVHFYLLSPCETFWTEQVTPQTQLKRNISALRHGKQVVSAETERKESHPLLASLCQQGREFQDMLFSDTLFAAEFKSFDDPLDRENLCVLHMLQSDLLQGEVTPQEKALVKDDSLIVVSAHSPYREMMILKDRILHWLESEPDLALKDMVVMAPDIQDYSGFIRAVFHDIPHSIADRNPALSNTFIAVFLQFLNLCSGRFGWNEVLDLLGREEVYPRFEIREDDLELVRHWVVSSGIRWGLSGEHKQGLGLPGREECTWRSGLDRLMMGYAMGEAIDVDGVLPFQDIEGGMAEALGGLSLFCETLEHACEVFSRSHSLEKWSELLGDYVERLFVIDGNDNLSELHGILADLGREYGRIHEESLSFEVICSWVESAATEKKSSSGFLRGQLTFCSMLPMRSIPFQKVCLLGLNDTVFPKNDRHPPFDLLGDQFLPGDRSRRSDDRYQFLEAILSARSSLYLSYVGQSIRSNDEMVPSVVVSELIELIEFYGLTDLLDVHPLHGFSGRYFSGDQGFFSYNRQLLKVSECLYKEHATPQPWWVGQLQKPQAETSTVLDLFSFFQNPQKYFVRNILNIRFGYGLASVEEHEPFVLDSLQKYLVDQDMVEASVRNTGEGLLRQQVQVAGQWPLGMPGEISFEKKLQEQHRFVEQLMAQGKNEKVDDLFVDLSFDGLQITGQLSSFYANGSFLSRYAKLKGKDVLVAWVHHCLSTACFDDGKDTRLLAQDCELLFPAGTGIRKDLQELLALFLHGQKSPSMLFVEPAFAYAVQREKTEKSGRGDPLAKAVQSVEKSLKKGMETEWELVFQGQDPQYLFGQEFVDLCDWFYQSIWMRAHVREL